MQFLSNVKFFDRENIFGVKFYRYDLFRPLPPCRATEALGAIDFLIFPTFVFTLAENHTNNIETIESPKVFVDFKAKMASNVFLRSCRTFSVVQCTGYLSNNKNIIFWQ